MGTRSRFVRPETKTLQISDGDSIVVRKKLSTGQTRQVFAKMSTREADGKRVTDSLKVGVSMVAAYLLDWSLVGFDGKKVEIAGLSEEQLVEVLDDLEFETFEEIRVAINKHVGAETEARETEKNSQDGATESSATSPSLGAVTGDTSGSPS